MSTFLRRATYWIVNQSSIPSLLQRVQKANGPRPSEIEPGPNTRSRHAATNATTILTAVAKHSPALFQPHLAELCKVIASSSEATSSRKQAPGPLGVEIALMALANVVRWDSKLAAGLDKKTNERIVKLALGSDWRQAKFSARYLAFAKNSAELCTEVIEVCETNKIKSNQRLPDKTISSQ
jgi:sister-chromatid-cohesion protein PDS5